MPSGGVERACEEKGLHTSRLLSAPLSAHSLFTPCLFTPSSYGRYDVWQRRSLGTLAGAGFTSAALAPRDSAFVTLADC